MLVEEAARHKVFIVGGTVPETDGDKVYNTCVVVSPDGEIIAKHRKVHLFDIDVPRSASHPGVKFTESEVLTGGESLDTSMFELPVGPAGVGVCYDVRFPELALNLTHRGARLLVFPGQFNLTTGPLHWQLLARARAVDNQAFVVVCSTARPPLPDFQAWGHSMAVSPWGDVLHEFGHEPGVAVVELDFAEVDKIRAQIPTSRQKRADVYAPYAARPEEAAPKQETNGTNGH